MPSYKILEMPKWKYITYHLIFAIFSIFILSFLHELGHIIVAKAFGCEIIEISLSGNPFVVVFEGGWVQFNCHGLSEKQLIIISASGSLFTLIFGFISLAIALTHKLNPVIESALFWIGTMTILDVVFYNLLDVFFVQNGDWYYIFTRNPYINGIVMIFSFVLVWFWFKELNFFRKEITLIME